MEALALHLYFWLMTIMNETNSHLEKLNGIVAASVVLVVFVAVDDFVFLVVAVARDWSSLLAPEVAVVAVVDSMRIGEVSRDGADSLGVDSLLH